MSEIKRKEKRKRRVVSSSRLHQQHKKLNIRWLEQNYSEVVKCYDLKLKSTDYNSNRNRKQFESPLTGSETMVSNVPRGANSKQQGVAPNSNQQQNKKMFNNFLDSLDIVQTNAPVNTSMQLNSGSYQQRTKSGSQQHHGQGNSKLQAQQNQAVALRQLHNNTVQSGESHTAGKRNKQLVSTSYNIAPAQLAQ